MIYLAKMYTGILNLTAKSFLTIIQSASTTPAISK